VNVDKADVGSVDKEETESDDVDEDEDTNEDVQVKRDDDSSYAPGISLGYNDEDEDDAVGGNNDNADDVGEDEAVEDVIVAEDEVGGVETNTKRQKLHYDAWVNNYKEMVSFYNTNGHCIVKRRVATAEGCKLGNLVHDQRKKINPGTLSDDRITLLSDLQFDFLMQTNVVEKKLTVPVAISRIFKYKKEHGNVAVPNKEPQKQLRRWIVHPKSASKKIIAQGSGNPKFSLPNLKLLHKLGIIQLPPDFKLKETTTAMSATKKEKKKMTNEPPKAEKPQGARTTVPRVSVPVPQKNITTPRPNANAPIQPKIKLKIAPKKISSAPRATAKASIEPNNILQTPPKSTQVSSPPTRTSPRLAATASNISRQQGTSSFSVLNNPFSKVESTPAYPS
jgi:hypothetical protein